MTAQTKLTPLVPNITLLNKAIHAETQPILYGNNEFIFEDTTALYQFLAGIGSKNVATLTDITVNGWGDTKSHRSMNHPAMTLLVPAVNLERLMIDYRIHYNGYVGAAR